MDLQAAQGGPNGLADILRHYLTLASLQRVVTVALILVLGFAALRLIIAAVRRIAKRRLGQRAADIADKLVKYGGATVILVNASNAAGIDLSAAIGAAGIVGIAIGFAAQTSVSNIISGLFLFSEKAFEPGDVVQVESMLGSIESVDMLSVKIRTFDNRLVRVPNETMIKSNLINVTRWPERRLDVNITLPYGSDLVRAEALLRETASLNPLVLASPEPFFLIDSLGPNGAALIFGVWFKKDDFIALKNSLVPGILARLDKAGLRPSAQLVALLPPPPHPTPAAKAAAPKTAAARAAARKAPAPAAKAAAKTAAKPLGPARMRRAK